MYVRYTVVCVEVIVVEGVYALYASMYRIKECALYGGMCSSWIMCVIWG